MVTGYGARGGRGRCFFLWQDFMKCISQAGKVSLDVCHAEREDYLECLHHNKLVRERWSHFCMVQFCIYFSGCKN